MAYAIKYLFKFESSNGTTREIRVLQDGYTGEVIQRPLGRAPLLKKQQNGPVHGTSLEFYAECHVDREFIEFYTSDPKAYRVDLYAGATLLWQGYITPELYSEPDIAPPYDVRVVATDGVGELKLYDYAAQGTVTLRALLSGLLARTGLGTDVYLISSLKAGSRGAGALLDMTINLDYMAGKTCYETLTYILDTLHATITWWKGAWILTRETNVTFTNGKVRYFNTAGNSALLADSVQTLGNLRANPAWPVGQLSTVIDPAKNRVAVQAPWHVVTCLQNSDMTSDAGWAKSNDASYGPDGYLFPNNDEGTGTYATAYISQALAMEGLRVPMSFELRATGVSAQVGVRVGAAIGVLLTYTVGDVVYHLRKGREGTPEWTPGPAIGTNIDGSLVDYQRPLASFDMDRIQAETLQITDIPAFVQGTSYPSGTLTVYILGTCARVYAATLDVILPKGYQDILHIDNGARGEGSEVEVAIGRETADNAYYAAFLQGLLLDSGNLITSFSDANFPAGMDYLAFIARDYALSVALPRAKVTGTVYLESGIAAPPLVFTKGALNYWLQTWSWNLKEDELEIDALTLPSASLMVESETILESNGSTVSSADSAGSSGPSSSMGVGTNYFELAADPTLVHLRQAYSYLGPRKGLIFDANEEADTNADFEKVALPGGGYALHSRLPFYSDSFISAGGISPGGGASAGNATLVAQTYGGTLSATGIEPINFYSKEKVDQLLATAGTVQTVAGVSPTSGDIPVASLKSALGLGAAAAYGIGSVASGSTGLVTGGSVYSAINEAVSSVMKMQGTTTTPISDGSTTNPVVIDGSSYTAKKGDVVLYDGKEYLWAGSAWEQLGDEASWALKTTSISAGTGLEGGGTLAANRTISINSTYQTYISHGESAYNSLGDYLPLTAGSGYPLTGSLYIDTASEPAIIFKEGGIEIGRVSAASTDGVRLYSGGAGFPALAIKPGVEYPIFRYNLVDRIVWHSGNSNLDTVDWTANQMIANSFKLAPGTPTLTWDATNSAWHLSGNFYADGFISAGGLSPGGGSGGIDPTAMWQLLGDSTNEQIAVSHLATALNGYATQDWVMGRGYITGINSSMITTALGYTPVAPSALADYVTLATSQRITGDKIFDSANLSVPSGSLYISNYGNDTIDQWINFNDASGKNAQIGIRRAIDTYGPTYHYKYGSIEYYYKFWHEGNFTPSDYLTTVSATSTYAKLRTYNDLTFASNEFTFAQAAHSGALWFNARTASGSFDGAISYYRMGNGAAGYAGIMASGYYLASNADNSYVLTAGGGSAAISGLTVATATNCVLKSGDTMTGALTINTTSYGNQLIVKRNESNYDAMIRFENVGDGLLGYLGIRGSGTAASERLTYSTDGTSAKSYAIYHSGNSNLNIVTWSCASLNVNRQESTGVVPSGVGLEIQGYSTYIALKTYTSSAVISTSHLTLDNAGNVGIGTASPASTLDVAGVIHASTGIYTEGYISAGATSSSSDERLKSGIKDFGYSAEMLMALRPREWDWNEKSYMKGHAAGVVAQELQQVMPYAIVERQYLSVNYDMLHGLEIAGLQDHETRIRQLERENAELKRRLNMN